MRYYFTVPFFRNKAIRVLAGILHIIFTRFFFRSENSTSVYYSRVRSAFFEIFFKLFSGPKKDRFRSIIGKIGMSLTAESVESTALPLQSIDDIHSGDGLPLGVFSVGDSVTDHVFQEDLEDTSGLFIDESADSLDSTSASQSTDGGLRDTLDIVTKNLPVTLSASLSKTFASFTTSRHLDLRKFVREFKAIRESNVDCKNFVVYAP